MPIAGLCKVSLDSADDKTKSSTSDLFGVGTLAIDTSTNSILAWVKNGEAATATAIGDALVPLAAGTAWSVQLSPATAERPLIGFAAGVIAAGSYGWAYVYGPGYALLDGTTDVAVGDPLSTKATAKTVMVGDDVIVAISLVAWTTNSAAVKAVFVTCL